MKKQFMMIAVALLTAGVLTTSCSSDDAAIETQKEQTAKGNMLFTATVEAKGGTTRSVNESGVTTWVVNEQITVYYQKTDDSYGTAIANVDAVNGGVATISAALSNAKDGGTAKFVYPASLVNATGDDIDATKLAAQHGTIADISANFDASTATATLATNGTTCGTTETIAFTNRVLIGKFTPKLNGTAIDEITTLTVTAGTQTYTVTPESPATSFSDQGIYVAMLPVSDKKVSLSAVTSAQTYIFGGKNISLSVGKIYNNLAVECYPQTINLATIGADYTALDGQILTGTLDGSTKPYKISIADGASVTLDGVTINGTHNSSYKWAGITCLGDATIILSGTNTVKGFYEDYPGIYVPVGSTVTINGSGLLTASSNGYGAGIGGVYKIACGNIEIQGGTVTATGGNQAAGIGSGYQGTCGNITISGGTVTATGGPNGAAGIGSGPQGTCGNITITTGVTKVTATKGNGAPKSIGAGLSGTCGTVTIGGTEYASGISQSPYEYPTALIVNPVVGQVIGNNGKNYADAAAAEADGATAVAKIVYVGSDNGEAAPYNHGLALALSDAGGGSYFQWRTLNSDAGHTKQESSSFTSESGLQYNAMHNSDTYPAFKAAIANNGTAAPTGCSAWFLASGYQWTKMFAGNAGGLKTLAGLQSDNCYWSSSERIDSHAWNFYSEDGLWDVSWKEDACLVRSCLAF